MYCCCSLWSQPVTAVSSANCFSWPPILHCQPRPPLPFWVSSQWGGPGGVLQLWGRMDECPGTPRMLDNGQGLPLLKWCLALNRLLPVSHLSYSVRLNWLYGRKHPNKQKSKAEKCLNPPYFLICFSITSLRGCWGQSLPHIQMSTFSYMDDVVLLSLIVHVGLRRLLFKLSDFSKEESLSINYAKTKIMVFGRVPQIPVVHWQYPY